MELPFSIGEKIVILRTLISESIIEVITSVEGYHSTSGNCIDSVLYRYRDNEWNSWEYLYNCRKLTPLEKLI
jgi:hypothetical protein